MKKLNQSTLQELENLVENEYQENGWVDTIGLDKSPTFWANVFEEINKVSDNENLDDLYMCEVTKFMQLQAKINIAKL